MEKELGLIIMRIFSLMEKLRFRTLTSLDRSRHLESFDSLTHRQGQAYFTVAASRMDYPEGMRMSELADRLQMSLPATSVLVDTLVRKGIFVRSVCPDDRRCIRVFLSEESNQDFDLINHDFVNELRAMLATLSEEERYTFIQAVRHLYEMHNLRHKSNGEAGH